MLRSVEPTLAPTTVGKVGARPEQATRQRILSVVLEVIEADGCDAVNLRDVARRSRLSLATIYELYPSRDELMVCAVEQWMETNAYSRLTPIEPRESTYETLIRGIRAVFEPWQRSPNMLRAFHRARLGSGGDRLDLQGVAAVEPAARAALGSDDPDYVRDVELILRNVVYGVIARFTDGDMAIEEVLPTLERAVYRLTTDNRRESDAP